METMADLLPPHNICLSSSPDIIALLVVSNISIALAYFIIPAILLIALRRFPVPMPTIVALFGMFITGCGATHVVEIVTMYSGGYWYWLQVVVLSFTGIVSLTTAAVLLDVLLRPTQWINNVR